MTYQEAADASKTFEEFCDKALIFPTTANRHMYNQLKAKTEKEKKDDELARQKRIHLARY